MLLSRRALVRSAASVAIAAPALRLLGGCASAEGRAAPRISGLALRPDPAGVMDLAPGLNYAVLSREGDVMSDGLREPGDHDGMAAFAVDGDPGRCLLVRNHELSPGEEADGAFAGRGEAGVDPALIYDRRDAGPLPGGTTTLLVNLRTKRLERSNLSLAGTAVNCAGGPTPWGSWLSCEETELAQGEFAGRSHGFVFEVPAAAHGVVQPVPLTAMGRFRHEAAAIDPATGVVYLTEDTADSLFYRFLPDARGQLAKGGRLQALALVAQSAADTRNWPAEAGGNPAHRFTAGQFHQVRWIDMADVEAPDADLRMRGRAAGAAVFARGEGMAFALEAEGASIYFTATSGGAAQVGQVWRYLPSPYEGTAREADLPGRLELYVESSSGQQLDHPDNIVASPRGDLIVCEDGPGDNFLRVVTPDGLIYPIARNAHIDSSELCGACFSPDGGTLFVNVQNPGTTLAIWGDWDGLRRAARRAA